MSAAPVWHMRGSSSISGSRRGGSFRRSRRAQCRRQPATEQTRGSLR